ncbi:protease HtpX [Propionigenium maris DSM 9537]|uniref:Protease HtpX homolog n=1 Tax=Propionigenium maris DSM 9537 TaxID=1123000 RepID=A0A9W6LNA2_9FUSO|nr:zinc metalloprotease HtpX [Propionigenium maris]GLI56689.1 protease HtpX [Propionigenium maris DSM 9537]
MKTIKTFMLMSVMTLILLFFGNLLGGRSGMTIALIFSFGMNFFSYWFSDRMVLAMYRAQPLERDNKVYQITERIARNVDLPMPKVYIINQSQPNAFATGRNPKNAAVAVTRGLLEILDDNELAGVIGHELGHVNNRDILIGTIAASMAGAISYLASMARWAAIFGGGRRDDDEGGNPIALIATAILAPLAAALVQMAISRTREYKADEYGAKAAGNALYLARALRKLEMWSKNIPFKANPATSHMFIVSPLSGEGMANLFSTHPSTAERIKRLEEMAERGF